MPSPFPGMDPWLESPGVFPDIHDALIFLLREAMNGVLPAGYRARGANRIWMEEDHQREPDVSLVRPPAWEATGGGLAVEAFTRVGMLDVQATVLPDPVEERYLEIRIAKQGALLFRVVVLIDVALTQGVGLRQARGRLLPSAVFRICEETILDHLAYAEQHYRDGEESEIAGIALSLHQPNQGRGDREKKRQVTRRE